LIPAASAAASPPRLKNLLTAAWLKAAGLTVLVVLVSQYLAAFVFLGLYHLDPREARPLTVLRYAYYWGDRADIRHRAILSSAAGFLLLLIPGVLLLIPRTRPLHGEARYATRREIKRARLLGQEGIILGQLPSSVFSALWRSSRDGFKPIVLGGQTGVSLTAEPGAGKGVSACIPNLLHWSGSVVCTDPKIENWTITAGYRRFIGQKVYLFNPLSPQGRTARWNPLDYVSSTEGQRVSDVQLIAHMFFPDPPGADPFWAAGGRSLFLGIALYLFDTPSLPRTIGEILRQGMANDEEGFAAHWKRVIQGRMSGKHLLSDTCVRALYDVIDLAPQTASSIRKTFTSRLELWANPILDAATAASDFDLRDLRKCPMSIYLGVMPKDLDRLAPLMSLFFQQAIALQTDQLPEHNPALKYQVLMVMDEFPAFGRIPILTKASGFLRGFNVRLLIIMQALSQIKDTYGENGATTLMKTMAARIHFAPKDIEDATAISNELGFTTVKVKSRSRPPFGSMSSKGSRPGSINTSEQRRALMLPQEVKEIGRDGEILFVENLRPILCQKITYYRIPLFRVRLLKAPQVPVIEPVKPTPRAKPDAPKAEEPSTVTTREATLADIERIESLTLEDFAADFDQVVLPEKAEGESLTSNELTLAAQSFLDTLRSR
jgi:type IV secretion system protein VirD4